MTIGLLWGFLKNKELMSKRKVPRNMARPRVHRQRQLLLSRNASSAADAPQRFRLARKLLTLALAPTGQQFLALALIAFGLLTIFTVAGLNSGAWVNAWARLLVFLFGWGAYPVGTLITALGLLWLRHLVHQPTGWRWRPILGLELTLIALLCMTHTLLRQYGWTLVQSGQGGGVIGWALSVFFSNAFGPLVTATLMGGVAILGIGLAFDLTSANVLEFGQRLAAILEARRALRKARRQVRREAVRAAREARRAKRRQARIARQAAAAREKQIEATAPPSADEDEEKKPALPQPATQKPLIKPPAKPKKAAPQKPARLKEGLPPLDLLREGHHTQVNAKEYAEKSRIIEETLAEFGLPAKVTEVRPGPTVTQFGVSPGYINRRGDDGENGGTGRKVRVSQIAALANDLALALAAQSLRVEAPVPGRAVVGVEVPNDAVDLVTLRAVLDSKVFRSCGKPLCFAVGLDVAGWPIVADLTTMPHLLVAGTTGSGKSVFVKALASSLIMNNPPEDLRLIALDPKIVELSHFNGLPHLLGKVVTELEDSIKVLRWAAVEMDNRYKLFAESVARNLDDYNQRIARKQDKEILPRIVILIDELADLMMAMPESTERTLTRIAQMARATGIHLVVATQRPSTDVVTGLIKANFPARISFATASSTDSRVILDTPGAESLLGRGDMLFLPPDASAPVRVQGCHVSDEELEAIIKFWQKSKGATPAEAPWDIVAETSGPEQWRLEGEHEDADLLERAIAMARKKGKVSTSAIQRRLRISYPRAARLMEQMEDMGMVGPQRPGRPRRVISIGDDDEDT